MAVLVLAAGLPLLVTGCGENASSPLRSHLQPARGEKQLLSLRDQTGQEKKGRIEVPAGTTQLLLRADCLGGPKDSTMRISVSSAGGSDLAYGGGEFGCTRSSGHGGLVILGDETDQAMADATYTISAPRGATWSATVGVKRSITR
ncbi:hypothetical protein [Marmoricola endophyticus]|uniref:hypothetical protein n=1 Tax=Marmoricola endophyticus TaxID=2040280 RepID=UPI00166C8898|nr:hypothetical protein [Marmoricola endophyticus]